MRGADPAFIDAATVDLVRRVVAGYGRPRGAAAAEVARLAASLGPGLSDEAAWEAYGTLGLVPFAWADDRAPRFVADGRAPYPASPGPSAVLRQAGVPGVLHLVRAATAGGGRLVACFEQDAAPFDVAFEVGPRAFDGAPPPVGGLAVRAPTGPGPDRPWADALRGVPPRALGAALAADAAGVAAAEGLAREAVERAAPWLTPGQSAGDVRVAWQSEVPHPLNARDGDASALFARASIDCAEVITHDPRCFDLDASLDDITPGRYFVATRLRDVLRPAVRWRAAARWGLRLAPAGSLRPAPSAIAGRAFAELPDPLTPLAEILALGYRAEDTLGPWLRLSTLAPDAPR